MPVRLEEYLLQEDTSETDDSETGTEEDDSLALRSLHWINSNPVLFADASSDIDDNWAMIQILKQQTKPETHAQPTLSSSKHLQFILYAISLIYKE